MVECTLQEIAAVAQKLLAGQVGIVPTDSIYGLIAVASNVAAKKKLFKLKTRDTNKECSIVVSDLGQLESIMHLNSHARQMLINTQDSVTILGLKRLDNKHSDCYSQTNLVGVRITCSAYLKQIIAITGPLFCTSVNQTNQQPLNKYDQLIKFNADFLVFDHHSVLAKTGQPTHIYNSVTQKWIR